MPLALLLSPDDQAVSAITAVLEEMSVTCERPLDGSSAAQKLNSNSFDLVVVDCENLPAAKLIFDVCRRGKGGNNPVQIAIVDGRAGLPTAFRLGAELILTKPVAKDQARNTIRTAVARIKKEDPARTSHPPEHVAAFSTDALDHEAAVPASLGDDAADLCAAPAAVLMGTHELSGEKTSYTAPRALAMAAAASAGSSQLTSYSDVAPASTLSFAASTPAFTASASAVEAAAPAITNTMNTAVAEPESVSVSSEATASAPSVGTSSVASESKPPAEDRLSEDPVMTELEQAEVQPQAEAAPVAAVPQQQEKPTKSKADRPEGSKSRGSMVALFALMLACAGFYFAWAYEPWFQARTQSQINRALALAGIVHPVQSVHATPVKPAAQPVAPSVTSPAAPAQSSQPAGSGSSANTSGTAAATTASGSVPASAASASKNQASTAPAGSTTSATPVSPAPATGTTPTAPVVSSPASKPSPNQADLKKPQAVKLSINPSQATSNQITLNQITPNQGAVTKTTLAQAAAPSGAELPWEKTTAIVLSSKGAEKRLEHSVQPTYPAGQHPDAAQGSVVLKVLVNDQGNVASARVVEGNAALTPAAISAVTQFRYHPYVRDGKALPFQTIVLLDFPRP